MNVIIRVTLRSVTAYGNTTDKRGIFIISYREILCGTIWRERKLYPVAVVYVRELIFNIAIYRAAIVRYRRALPTYVIRCTRFGENERSVKQKIILFEIRKLYAVCGGYRVLCRRILAFIARIVGHGVVINALVYDAV